jgi:hypothetical protein
MWRTQRPRLLGLGSSRGITRSVVDVNSQGAVEVPVSRVPSCPMVHLLDIFVIDVILTERHCARRDSRSSEALIDRTGGDTSWHQRLMAAVRQ